MKKINLKNKFKKFSEHWSPKVIAELNDYQFKLVKIKDDFVWHNHQHTDEAFIVIKGQIFIEFEDRIEELNEGTSGATLGGQHGDLSLRCFGLVELGGSLSVEM